MTQNSEDRSYRNGVAAVALVMALGLGAAQAATGSGNQLETARAYLQKNKLQEAAITLKNVIKANPRDVGAHLLLAEVYVKAGSGLAAQSEIDLARGAGAPKRDTALLYARALQMQGNNDAALKELDAVTLPEGQRADALTLRGDAFLGKKTYDKAEAAYVEAGKLAPRNALSRLGLARLYLETKKFPEARAKADEAVALEPGNPYAHMMRGMILQGQQDVKGALASFGTALNADPNYLPAIIDRAALLLDTAQTDAAKPDVDKLGKLAPQHPMYFYLSALYQSQKGKYKEAQETLGRSGSALSKFMPATYLGGVLAYANGNRQVAIARLQQVITAIPTHLPARRVLASALIQDRRGEEAIRVLQPVVDSGQADAQVRGLLGMAQMQAGDYDGAVENFDTAAASDKQRAVLYETQEALGQVALGQSDAAMKSLDSVLKANPNDSRAAIIKTLIAARKGDLKTANASVAQVIKMDPKNPVGYNVRGMLGLAAKQYPTAEKDFQQALKLNPKFRTARINLARTYAFEKKMDAAEGEFRKVLAEAPNDDGALAGLATLLQAKGQSREAVKLLEAAVTQRPKVPQLRVRLVSAYMSGKNPDGAIRAAESADRDIPNNPGILTLLGDLYASKKQWSRATTVYDRVVSLKPENMGARLMLGQAQYADKKVDAARLTLSNALKLKGQDSVRLSVLNQLITIESQAGKFDQALRYATELRNAFPKENYSEKMMGELYSKNKRYKEALVSLQAAKKKKPDEFGVRIALFNVYNATGQQTLAVNEVKDFLTKYPKSQEAQAARGILGNAYLQAKMYKEAAAAYEQVIKVAPKDASAYNNLAWAYMNLNDRRAIQMADTAARLSPKSPPIQDTLGWILVKFNQDLPRAVAVLQLAARDMPREASVQYHLAAAMAKTGRKAEARDILRKILQKGQEFEGAADARALLKSLGG